MQISSVQKKCKTVIMDPSAPNKHEQNTIELKYLNTGSLASCKFHLKSYKFACYKLDQSCIKLDYSCRDIT